MSKVSGFHQCQYSICDIMLLYNVTIGGNQVKNTWARSVLFLITICKDKITSVRISIENLWDMPKILLCIKKEVYHSTFKGKNRKKKKKSFSVYTISSSTGLIQCSNTAEFHIYFCYFNGFLSPYFTVSFFMVGPCLVC